MLIVTSTLLWVWAGIWMVLFPALLISDADNGQFNHDLSVEWLPEVGLSIVGAMACLLTLRREAKRPQPWRVLVVPVTAVVAIATLSAVIFTTARR